MTNKMIAYVTVLVKDYDEAIDFYTNKLDFILFEDTKVSEHKRWVLVGPKNNSTKLLLAKASTKEQEAQIGNQTGGRVFLFLHTDDFKTEYNKLIENKVNFLESPRHEEYGTVAVFEDLYKNKWDLLELKNQ